MNWRTEAFLAICGEWLNEEALAMLESADVVLFVGKDLNKAMHKWRQANEG